MKPIGDNMYKTTQPKHCYQLYIERKHCKYCEQPLPKDFHLKKELARRERIKETLRKKKENGH